MAAPRVVVGAFGEYGSGDGGFSSLGGLAVNQTSGAVYAVDVYGDRVEAFSASGTYLSQFGSEGEGAGQLMYPQGVAIEQTTGDVYVTDQGNHRVDEFQANGTFIRAFGANVGGVGVNVCTTTCQAGSSGSNDGEFGEAIGNAAVDPVSGDVYVADPSNNRVQRFHANGIFVSSFGGQGSGSGQFGSNSPTRVAVDPSGNVYALDSGSPNFRVLKFESDGDPIAVFSSALTTGSSEAVTPAEVTVDPTTGAVLVSKGVILEGRFEHLIYELDSAGSLVALDGEEAGLPGSSGMAVGATSGDLYYSGAGKVLILNATPAPPEASIQPVTGITANDATYHAAIDPHGQGLSTSYQFEYSTDQAQWTTGFSGSIGASGAPTEVEVGATAQGYVLEGNTHYYLRLHVQREFTAGTTTGDVQFTTLAAPPSIGSFSFSDAGSASVELKAQINPENSNTSYYFEYGPTAAYGSSTPVVDVGVANGLVGVQGEVGGLQLGTTYHFRLVATNEDGTARSGDLVLSTYAATLLGLPDKRGYEKVSPNNNDDGNVYPPSPEVISSEGGFSERPFEAAADGSALVYMADPSEKGGGGHEGAGGGNQYLATRAPEGGWTATNLDPPSDEFFHVPTYQVFSKNLTVGLLTSENNDPLVPGAPASGYSIPYLRNLSTGSYEALLLRKPPNRSASEFKAYETPVPGPAFIGGTTAFAGASSDFKHVLYMANDALTLNAVDGGAEENNLYDFHEGALTLVNMLPSGTPEPNATFGGPVMAPDSRENSPDLSNVISADGARIFWTGLGENHNLYLREDGVRTVQVDASVGGGGQFWTATSDGSKAIFTKAGDIYEYDVNDGQTTDLTPGGEVLGVSAANEDLSYVYFVASAALAPGAKQQTCEAGRSSSECNLYVLHVGEPVKFIGVLSGADDISSPNSFYVYDGVWQGGLASKETEVTSDGHHFIFGSVAPLTGFANQNPEHQGTEQIFMYDFEGGKLSCISCNPTGEAPSHTYSAYLPVSHMNAYTKRWMSDSGDRVFFNSLDALVPQDTDGLNDVYEWERDGAGSCTQSNGCIYLISSGTGSEGSYFIDASTNGDDAFFTTRAQLVSEDQNQDIDAYDARVGAATPPATPQCIGTGCQGLPSAPPVFATPSSVTYNGVGNFLAPSKAASKAKKPKAKKPKKKPKKSKKKHTRKHNRANRAALINKSAKNNGRVK